MNSDSIEAAVKNVRSSVKGNTQVFDLNSAEELKKALDATSSLGLDRGFGWAPKDGEEWEILPILTLGTFKNAKGEAVKSASLWLSKGQGKEVHPLAVASFVRMASREADLVTEVTTAEILSRFKYPLSNRLYERGLNDGDRVNLLITAKRIVFHVVPAGRKRSDGTFGKIDLLLVEKAK